MSDENADKLEEDDKAVHTVHNKFALECYGDPERARGLLEAQLPASLLAIVDLDNLEVINSRFIHEGLIEVAADLLFRLPRTDQPGTDVYIYVLWEHQKERDSWMALRTWVYVSLLYRNLRQEKKLSPNGKLPFVYPIVLYQGKNKWEKGLDLSELIDLKGIDPSLHQWAPQFTLDLIWLGEDSGRVDPVDPVARLGLGMMRAVMLNRVPEWVEEHIEEIVRVGRMHGDFVLLLFNYAHGSKGLTSEHFRTIIENNPAMKLIYEKGSAFDMELREVTEKLNKAEEQVRQKDEQVRQTREQVRQKDEQVRQKDEQVRQKDEQVRQTVRNLIGMGFSDQELATITGFPLDEIAAIRLENSE